MNTSNYELTLSEKALLRSPVMGKISRVTTVKPAQQKAVNREYDEAEFTEIDPFTGRIRTIRRS